MSEWQSQMKKGMVNKKSERLLKQIRQERIKELFDLLDSDMDGKLSSEKIDLSQLSSKVLDCLTPFLVHLEANKLEIDFK